LLRYAELAICIGSVLRTCKMHGKTSRSIAVRMPTLNMATDDMTNQDFAVNMQAVRYAASARDNPVSQ
jgi:hypothetical protein